MGVERIDRECIDSGDGGRGGGLNTKEYLSVFRFKHKSWWTPSCGFVLETLKWFSYERYY